MSFCPREGGDVASEAKMPPRKTQPKARQLTQPVVQLQRREVRRGIWRKRKGSRRLTYSKHAANHSARTAWGKAIE